MSALTDAVARVVTAFATLQGAFDAAVEGAAAENAMDDAEIARLQGLVDAANADAAAAIAELANIAPEPTPVPEPVIDPLPA